MITSIKCKGFALPNNLVFIKWLLSLKVDCLSRSLNRNSVCCKSHTFSSKLVINQYLCYISKCFKTFQLETIDSFLISCIRAHMISTRVTSLPYCQFFWDGQISHAFLENCLLLLTFRPLIWKLADIILYVHKISKKSMPKKSSALLVSMKKHKKHQFSGFLSWFKKPLSP